MGLKLVLASLEVRPVWPLTAPAAAAVSRPETPKTCLGIHQFWAWREKRYLITIFNSASVKRVGIYTTPFQLLSRPVTSRPKSVCLYFKPRWVSYCFLPFSNFSNWLSSFSEFSDQFFTSQKMAKNLYQLTVQIAAYMCIFVFVDFEAFSVQKWSQKNVPIY